MLASFEDKVEGVSIVVDLYVVTLDSREALKIPTTEEATDSKYLSEYS